MYIVVAIKYTTHFSATWLFHYMALRAMCKYSTLLTQWHALHGVWAVSEWQQRAMGVHTDVVQHEAKMALEYLIFYCSKHGHLPCKQCEQASKQCEQASKQCEQASKQSEQCEQCE